jgi:hypothetical protein
MRIDINSTPDLLVVHSREIEAILRRAVHQAVMEHKQAGKRIAVWENGKVELIEAEKIGIEAINAPEQT